MLPEFPGQRLSPLAHQSHRSQIFELQPAGTILKYRAGGGRDEARMLAWLQQHRFPSPPLLDSGPDWILMGRIPGVVQDPDEPATYRDLGEILARLNHLSPPFPDLETMTSQGCLQWAEYCLENTRFLDLADPLKAALEPLTTLAPAGIIHNGPFWKNVLVDEQGRITGLIDWEFALLGPAAHQVGTALAFIAHPGKPASPAQIQQRQQAFLDGYGSIPKASRSFQLLRLLDSLSKAYRETPYQSGDYLNAQLLPGTRAEYQRLTRMQAELELRFLLDHGPGPKQA